ncbi:MAG: hypothetical protein IBJ03_18515 [Gemmatimonadaceae bacterium]|nr:hypothetical protein [Gemmatimonadaceae bacterium]
MTHSLSHPVLLQQTTPRLFAAVHARVVVDTIPRVFTQYLDQVYAEARAGTVQLDGQNIFLYTGVPERPNEADAAFGVGVTAPFSAIGDVVPTWLPVGEVVMTTLLGSYAGIRSAHQAVIGWCNAHGRQRTGIRWEVYGHWTEDESQLQTDVFHLLAPG